MRKLLAICIALAASIAVVAGSARAAISYGTPAIPYTSDPSPLFGTWIDFDDQATGTPVLENDYVAQGVASIVEVTGGTLTRYGGTQSQPNYIGTGSGYEIGGVGSGWDGIVIIDLTEPASQIGIGIADSVGEDYLRVYDSVGTLLEEHLLDPGTNIYPIISGVGPISRIEIDGDFFAADDLQFDHILEVKKELDSAVNPAGELLDPNDLPMYTDIVFTLVITVMNNGDDPITDIVLKDHFGADLEIDEVVSWSQGLEPVITTSKAKKSPQQRIEWSVGDLAGGASATLIVRVSTDINPGNSSSKNPKSGKQEYTSPGEHTLNSGANAKGMLGELEVCGISNSIIVTVAEED